MAYVSTYVCDFVDFEPPPFDRKGTPCRRLAETVCALCDKHGCYEHLKRGIRVVFVVCDRAINQPQLPMHGIDPMAVAAPFVSFSSFSKLTAAEQKIAREEGNDRAFTERAVCAGCALFTTTNPDVREPLQGAINGFVESVRAALAEAAMKKKAG